MSFFVADDKLPVLQQNISIPSENGLDYNSTQTIEINIPAGTKFINPKECYLQFDVKLTNDEASGVGAIRTMLDAETGAQVLLKDVRIYDGNKNQLLEEINDYNVLVAAKYDYETNESLKNKRAMLEGSGVSTIPQCRGDRGSTETQANQFINNPYYSNDPAEPKVTAFENATNMRTCKVCLPLHTGIFQNDAVFPTLLTNGLHISITLEEDRKVFRMLDSVAQFRRTTLNPIVLSETGAASASLPNGSNLTTMFTFTSNAQTDADNSPFVVGQYVNFLQTSTSTSASFVISGGAIKGRPQITQIATVEVGGIDHVRYTFDTTPQLVNATGATITTDGSWVMIDDTVAGEGSSYSCTYKISNCEMVLQQVTADPRYEQGMVSKMKEGGVISYDFLSCTNYKYSQLQSDRVANIRLPLNNARMKSIISIPTDATVYDLKSAMVGADTYKYAINSNRDFRSHSDRSGLVGISDGISNYSWFYDGRLQPSRRVDLTRTSTQSSISAQGLIELDKALTAADITTHSMRKYVENFAIGRAVAIGKNNVYDARNKDFNLQVNYQETVAPTKPKLWHNFVFHLRRMNIQGDSVSIEV